ncbi:hypothetical protein [Streptomyces pseudovenezuelae]|uniref:hypothetical protein n=1 Tax=Streptomyces pseudovenezuelae TaxID=67350 RepID=UPI002E817AA1|nr:hypothetical protein [Streptomyces pseudovenezuelae]WUA88334.1 hypothetical protein OHO81_13940 [Streptomyces pseudovenezuelae]
MGTKTADETGAETGAEATTDEQKVSVAKTDEVTEAEDTTADETAADDIDDEDELPEAAREEGPTGVGQGAGAVVSAALGLVSLTGSWVGTVAAARETLVGQLQTSSTASVAKQVKEVYGDAWQTTALWGGVFALFALVVGVGVLARPAFGAPGKPQAVWIKSVAWGGVALGVVGLLLAVLKYTGVLLDLPSTS